ncbi:hypothetical protein [African swine fever virus]
MFFRQISCRENIFVLRSKK